MKAVLLGGNIRPGQKPGGMTGDNSGIKVKSRGYGADVHAAAKAFLEKRGMVNHISDFERAALNFPRPSRGTKYDRA